MCDVENHRRPSEDRRPVLEDASVLSRRTNELFSNLFFYKLSCVTISFLVGLFFHLSLHQDAFYRCDIPEITPKTKFGSISAFEAQQNAAIATDNSFCAFGMKEEDLEVAIKVVIVGNGAVGKSSMIQRYCKGTFTKDYKKTIGVDFLERQLEMEGEDVRLMLWDTAGQEEFDAITKAYYRGAQACVLAFSTTDRDSFEAIHSWKMKVEDECGEIPTVLVQNKIDLMDQSVVDLEEADLLSRALGCRLIRTSVKEDININSVFRYLAARCLAEIHELEKEYNAGNGIHSLSIDTFGSPTVNGKSHTNGNGTIVLHPRKKGPRKRRNVLKSACRIL